MTAKPIKEAVTVVFKCQEKIYAIKRQNFLRAFPGYTAFPGGQVDKADAHHGAGQSMPTLFRPFAKNLMQALCREVQEELDFDLLAYARDNKVLALTELGIALTPEFNPYRFKTFFFLIELSAEISFHPDSNEISQGQWQSAQQWMRDFSQNRIMAVPPTVKVFKALAQDPPVRQGLDLNLTYDPQREVPMIESLAGVKQFLPLSNTFPPALRTNCFLIGKKLIDPSPKDQHEYKKLKNSVTKFPIQEIFLTHHHPDHHEHAVQLALELKIPMGMSADTYQRILGKWGGDYFQQVAIKFYKEGDTLTTVEEKAIKIFSVPGHDAGQLALAPQDNTWFLVGDLIQTVGTVVIGAPEGDMQEYFNSLERIIALNPSFIIPSHGIATGGVQRLQATLEHRQMREQQIVTLLKTGATEEQILQTLYPTIAASLQKYARKTIRAHLNKISTSSL